MDAHIGGSYNGKKKLYKGGDGAMASGSGDGGSSSSRAVVGHHNPLSTPCLYKIYWLYYLSRPPQSTLQFF